MSDLQPEITALREKLQQKPLPEELRQKAERMLLRLGAVQQSSGVSSYSVQELEIISKYVDWITALPFNQYTQDNLDLASVKQVLDKHHYGLLGVKESILEFIASKALRQIQAQKQAGSQTVANYYNTSVTDTPILCFIGVQGIGKTTMAKSIADALGRSFQRIALGAFASVHEIRGRSRSETAAEPGQIVKALLKAKSMNPVILLDEIDKVSDSSNLRADVMAALLEVLDPEQNRQFVDRYLDYPLDLSQVLFITTANNVGGISTALIDRMEMVRFASYSDDEKQQIAKNYILPKVRAKTGITAEQLDIADDAWPLVIRPLGFDPGIRQLERNLTNLARKVAKLVLEGRSGKILVTAQNFREFFPERIEVFT
jgi:ATP-dependent Lon protease